MNLTSDQTRVVLDWMRKLHTLDYAHRYEAMAKHRLNILLGAPVVIASAVVGAQIATTSQGDPRARVVIGLMAGIAGVLAALLTFLKPAELAEKHRIASVAYEALRHRLEYLILFDQSEHAEVVDKLDRFRADWEMLDFPSISTRRWNQAKSRVRQVGTYPPTLLLAIAADVQAVAEG